MWVLKNALWGLSLTMALLVNANGYHAHLIQNSEWAKAFYVSPAGNDGATGTREKPFATVQKAVSMLPDSGGGLIALLGGTYKEEIRLRTPPSEGEVEMLTITAAPGEKVLLQGGAPIEEWTSYNNEKGLYVIEAPDRQSLHSRTGYLNVWENTTRVRYRSQFDADGVRAYPGSTCLIDDTRILVHTRDGRDPKEIDLWRNRKASGLTIGRDNVTVQGLHFENFLGGSAARAITIGSSGATDYKGVTIANCSIVNSVRGLSVTADGTHIVNCDIREVGLGMVSYGNDMVVENCTIQSASGAFAIDDLNQHARDGIRYYSPARGGTVIGNVTVGFWTGFYSKCNTSGPDARPMRIENNIFLDGIRAGSAGPQPKNNYRCNIIGPNQERVDPMKDKLLQTATFEANYFFNGGGTDKNTNKAGANPFMNLVAGDLRIRADVTLPKCVAKETNKATVAHWSTPVAAALTKSLLPKDDHTGQALRFTKMPSVTSSQQGALISMRLSAPAKSTLRYRKVGTPTWETAQVIDNTLTRPNVVIGAAPILDKAQEFDFGLLFSLSNSELKADTDYEFFVELTSKGQPTLRSDTQKFQTSGGPKEIVVRAGSNTNAAQGTEQHPFTQLQAAFDRALPGDTIRLEKGVYTEPALLVHGGTPERPITIAGAGAAATILDGGKIAPVLMELRNTGNIIIRDLQVRWFGNAGISATNTENITIERCHFFNTGLRGSRTPNGSGLHLNQSPKWTISHCLFAKMEHGIVASRSPQLKLLNNTAYGNMYDGVSLYYSTEGSVITGNSFNFTGNDSMTIVVPNKEALTTLTCDYNNYGTLIRASEESRPENEFQAAARYGYIGDSKAMVRLVIDGTMVRLNRLDEWRKFTGKDAHSIFADPQFIDPLKVDFRLTANSPNILPNGRILGALTVLKRENRE